MTQLGIPSLTDEQILAMIKNKRSTRRLSGLCCILTMASGWIIGNMFFIGFDLYWLTAALIGLIIMVIAQYICFKRERNDNLMLSTAAKAYIDTAAKLNIQIEAKDKK